MLTLIFTILYVCSDNKSRHRKTFETLSILFGSVGLLLSVASGFFVESFGINKEFVPALAIYFFLMVSGMIMWKNA